MLSAMISRCGTSIMSACRLAIVALLTAGASLGPAWQPAGAAIDLDQAAALFREAKAICDRDAMSLWGRSVCGPILLVDPTDRAAVANEPDLNGALRPAGGVYVGTFAEPAILSNTPTSWSGKRWTQLLWPVHHVSDFLPPLAPTRWTALMGPPPSDAVKRRVTIAHELFHRIQPDLGLTRPEGGNRHLDTLEGRYFLQLEWRALAEALAATSPTRRRRAIEDALLFRDERYRRFPDAAAEEGALEINEGVPEYTGVRLGLTTPQERTRYAIYDLSAFVQAPTFVRSFAYATGPAYGLLLDRADPAWKSKLHSGARLDQLLSAALHLRPPAMEALNAREAVYDGGDLRAREVAREQERQLRLKALKAKLVDGPVLTLPLLHATFQFNPQTLQALDDIGTVYPTMRVNADWGILEVDGGGALLNKSMTSVAVSAAGIDARAAKGPGWRLTLKEGWLIAPGVRQGDMVVMRAPGAGQ
jgi:hypothetical protein